MTAQHLRSAAALALSEAASGRADGRERASGCGDGCYDGRADAYRLTTHCACAARRGDLRARLPSSAGLLGMPWQCVRQRACGGPGPGLRYWAYDRLRGQRTLRRQHHMADDQCPRHIPLQKPRMGSRQASLGSCSVVRLMQMPCVVRCGVCGRRSYREGDQVFLCYGAHSNLELLGALHPLRGFPAGPARPAALCGRCLGFELVTLTFIWKGRSRAQAASRCRATSAAPGPGVSALLSIRVPDPNPTLSYAAEHYGFLLPTNGHDRALLPPGAFGSLEPELAAAGLAPAARWLHPGGLPCWALLAALRVATAVSPPP